MMRLFIAIPLSHEIKKTLSLLQKRLAPSIKDAKWVEPENIHLTLKFLGEVNEKSVEDIAECCQKVVAETPAFLISLEKVGSFPNLVIPRVIWVGIKEGKERVKGLAKDLEERLHKIGFTKETRPFSSHLTLARIRLPKRVSLQDLKIEQTNMRVLSIQLIQSTLTPKKAVYQVLKGFELCG
ncbi:MAG: RNA 2',3'-cyclic phosphodiesterase [bacterium]|nr:RNA 2',3'-cyclic phosphodiesterase [bacterium]